MYVALRAIKAEGEGEKRPVNQFAPAGAGAALWLSGSQLYEPAGLKKGDIMGLSVLSFAIVTYLKQELGRWASLEQLQRYAAVDLDHAATRLAKL